jgi:hypothetical protein
VKLGERFRSVGVLLLPLLLLMLLLLLLGEGFPIPRTEERLTYPASSPSSSSSSPLLLPCLGMAWDLSELWSFGLSQERRK